GPGAVRAAAATRPRSGLRAAADLGAGDQNDAWTARISAAGNEFAAGLGPRPAVGRVEYADCAPVDLSARHLQPCVALGGDVTTAARDATVASVAAAEPVVAGGCLSAGTGRLRARVRRRHAEPVALYGHGPHRRPPVGGERVHPARADPGGRPAGRLRALLRLGGWQRRAAAVRKRPHSAIGTAVHHHRFWPARLCATAADRGSATSAAKYAEHIAAEHDLGGRRRRL